MIATEAQEQARLQYLARRSLKGFLASVKIDCRPEPEHWGLVWDDWQEEWVDKISGPLEQVMGLRKGYVGPVGNWRTYPRGHDKTGSFGRICLALLSISRRKVSVGFAASDQDQAQHLVQSMKDELALNPWIRGVKIGQKSAEGPTGRLVISNSNAGSEFGAKHDVCCFDELTHWRDDDLWDTHTSGLHKRQSAVILVITNAGIINSWQWKALQKCKKNPQDWDVFESEPGEHLASWMLRADVERSKAMMSDPIEVRRVIENEWINPSEATGYLNDVEVQSCEDLGRELRLSRKTKADKGKLYYFGVDYGPKKDRTALSVIHLEPNQDCHVDVLDVMEGKDFKLGHPPWHLALRGVVTEEDLRAMDDAQQELLKEGKKIPDYWNRGVVPIALIENWIVRMAKIFNPHRIVIDRYQMVASIERLEASWPVEEFQSRGSLVRNYELAQNLRSLISNRRMAWYPEAGQIGDETFTHELQNVVLDIKDYGYRIDHELTEHDDRVISVGMAALRACQDWPWQPGQPKEEEVKKVEDPGERDTWDVKQARDRSRRKSRHGLYGMG